MTTNYAKPTGSPRAYRCAVIGCREWATVWDASGPSWVPHCKAHEVKPPTHPDIVDPEQGDLFDQPKARKTDPKTSHTAASIIKARSGSARVVLLEAHGRNPEGLTDEEAAVHSGLPLTSEYATRMSELERAGLVHNTGDTRVAESGMERIVRAITPLGQQALRERALR